MKTCSKCGTAKPESDFYMDKQKSDGLTSRCVECIKLRKSWSKGNPKAWQKSREWYEAHRERSREWRRGYYESNKEKAKARSKKRRLEKRLELLVYSRNRRIKRIGLCVSAAPVTSLAIRQRWEMWGGKCWLCGATATQTDHVKPLSKGGLHVPANLRPICTICNRRKSAKWPMEDFIHDFNL